MGGAPRELGADGLVGRRHREHPAAEVGQRSQRAPSSLAAVAAFARWRRSPPNGQMPPTSETLVGQGLPLHQAGPGDRRLDGAKPRSAVSPGDVIEGAAHLVNPPHRLAVGPEHRTAGWRGCRRRSPRHPSRARCVARRSGSGRPRSDRRRCRQGRGGADRGARAHPREDRSRRW